MSQTIREQIISALQTRLENYAWTSWDPSVFAGRSVFDPDVDTDRLPVLTILPSVEDSTRTKYRTDQITMQVDLSGLVSLEDGAEVYEHCEPVFGELRKACFYVSATDSSGAIQIGTDYFTLEYRGGGIITYPGELGPAIVTVGVTLAITYETATGDPYN